MQHNAGFTRDDVVTAALEIGVDRFTMGKVARQLGVSTADLGRTVSSRDDLLVACLERVSADVTLPPTGLSWQDYLRQLSDSLWDVLDANPGLDHTLIDLAWAYVPFMSVAKRAHNASVSGRPAHRGRLPGAQLHPLDGPDLPPAGGSHGRDGRVRAPAGPQ